MKTLKLTAVLAAAIAAASVAGVSVAEASVPAPVLVSAPAHALPHKAVILRRLKVQSHRIAVERADGRISAKKARSLRREDRMIRKEMRIDARLDHGRLTGAEKITLIRQENQVSRALAR